MGGGAKLLKRATHQYNTTTSMRTWHLVMLITTLIGHLNSKLLSMKFYDNGVSMLPKVRRPCVREKLKEIARIKIEFATQSHFFNAALFRWRLYLLFYEAVKHLIFSNSHSGHLTFQFFIAALVVDTTQLVRHFVILLRLSTNWRVKALRENSINVLPSMTA